MLVRVFIQNEAGSTRKNRHNERTCELLGSEQVSRPYPFPYGFIIGTLAADGMSVDCFVVTQQPLRTGETVACEPLALMEQFEDGVDDHNVLAKLQGEPAEVTPEIEAALTEFVQNVFRHVDGKRITVGRFLTEGAAAAHLLACADRAMREPPHNTEAGRHECVGPIVAEAVRLPVDPNEIRLRPGSPSDRAFLHHLHRESMRSHVERTWGAWNDEDQRRRFDDTTDPEVHDIIEYRGVTVGCQWIRQQPGCVELVRLYLLPEFQGRGIGTHLLTRLSARASSAGLPARLRVLRANPAQRLYGRLGFRIVEETETHLVMERAAQLGDGPDAGWNALPAEPRRSPPT
jgi:inorganic pyrophosphatase/GNAT superfamily N-acetyltransferase